MGEPASGGEPVSVFESGESLLYWGEITGQLLWAEIRDRTKFV
jgi:hypothetical protein